MGLSSKTSSRSLRQIHLRRTRLLRRLLRLEPVVIGNVYDVLRRCGNLSCHCATKPGHLQTLLIYVQKGHRRCKFVRREDAAWVKQAWKRYGECRKSLKELRALNQRELSALRAQIRQRGVLYE